jgi:capsular exopolysaccharide synthesis family protein
VSETELTFRKPEAVNGSVHWRSTEPLVALGSARSIWAEQFRRLKSVLSTGEQAAARVIVVTSPVPGDGKTFVAVNLALALSATPGTRVLLIDADLRRPTIDRMLLPRPQAGLVQVVERGVPVKNLLMRPEGCGLDVLPSGAPVDDPLRILSTPACPELFKELRVRYDRIVVDTSPIGPFTDADALGAMSDGILMVVRAQHTPKAMYQAALEHVHSTRVLGTVLNAATKSVLDTASYYGSYYRGYDRAPASDPSDDGSSR